jgi:hypothetical protein
MYKILIIIAATTILSCKAKKEDDLVQEVPKNGSIETSVSVAHYTDSLDILTTKHIVHTNSTTSKTVLTTDTIPALGTHTIEDEKGKKQEVKNDYSIYITVK